MGVCDADMPLRQFRFFPVATLISKSATTRRNVESLNAPRKTRFWLAEIGIPAIGSATGQAFYTQTPFLNRSGRVWVKVALTSLAEPRQVYPFRNVILDPDRKSTRLNSS